MQRYQRMTYEVRCQILAFLKIKISISEIAKATGYHKSTIYREIKRNSELSYDPNVANRKAKLRYENCRRRRMFLDPKLSELIGRLIARGWSPEQVSGRLRRTSPISVSKQTIYNEIKRSLPLWRVSLRRYGKRRGRGRSRNKKLYPAWRKSVHDRPMRIDKRKEVGHWERDTMCAKDRKSVVVFVERKSRYVRIAKVREPYSVHLTDQMKKMIKAFNAPVKSLTNDNGNEFLDGESYEIPVYYCDPRSPHQKGSVENAIGLLRQYINRQTDLNTLTDADLKNFEDKLNHRPRKCLDYKTPHEVLFNKTVALAS